jgi:hypothetical protein
MVQSGASGVWGAKAPLFNTQAHVQTIDVATLGDDRFLWVWVQKPNASSQATLVYGVTSGSGEVVRAEQTIAIDESVVDVAVTPLSGNFASIVLATAGAQQSVLSVLLVNANGDVQLPAIPIVSSERAFTQPIAAVRVRDDSTLAAWAERVQGGRYQTHLRTVQDDGTLLAEQVILSVENSDLPSLTTLRGVPAIAYRTRGQGNQYSIYAELRLPNGAAFGSAGPTLVSQVGSEPVELAVQSDRNGLGVAWVTKSTGSFQYLGCVE